MVSNRNTSGLASQKSAKATTRPSGSVLIQFEMEPRALPIPRVFAILPFQKCAGHALLSPDFLPRPLGVFRKVGVPLSEVEADGVLGGLDRRVIAVVNDRPGHSAKYRLDHIQELRSGRQWGGLNDGIPVSFGFLIKCF